MLDIMAALKGHGMTAAATALGALGGALGHMFGPAVWKWAGDKLAAWTTAITTKICGRLVKPDIKNADDYRNVSEMARNAIEMAERHLENDGVKKMKWVLDLICAKTELDRGEAGMIAQRVYDAQKAAAAAAVAIAPTPAPAIPAVK